MKVPRDDIEMVRRLAAALQSERGGISCHVVLSTGHDCTVFRDGRVALRTRDPEVEDAEFCRLLQRQEVAHG